jgi:hypothetical protein
VLRIPTLLIRIRLFTLIQIRIFNLIRIRLLDTYPDPYISKEVMYLKQYFYISQLEFLVSKSDRTQPQGYFVKFSLPINFVALISLRIREN